MHGTTGTTIDSEGEEDQEDDQEKEIDDAIEAEIDHGEHTPQALVAADLVLDNFDLRSKAYKGDYGNLLWHMQATYLPLPAQTQFVESLVKDAANASTADRSEQHRSCCFVRSVTPLARSLKDVTANKIKAFVQSAFDRSSPHVTWRREQIDNVHEARFAQIMCALSAEGHFKIERIEAKKANVDDKGDKFKRQNVSQRIPKQRHKTAAVSGLIPCGKLVKARNMEDLKIELLFRDVPEDVVPDSITERKDWLKMLEAERLMMDYGMPESDAIAHKAFKKLSAAPFLLTDD